MPARLAQVDASVRDPDTVGPEPVQLLVTDLVGRYAGRADHPPPRHTRAVLADDRADLSRSAVTDVLGDVPVRRDAALRDRLHGLQYRLDVLLPVHGDESRRVARVLSRAVRGP